MSPLDLVPVQVRLLAADIEAAIARGERVEIRISNEFEGAPT